MKRIRFYNFFGLLNNIAIIILCILAYNAIAVKSLNYARYDIVATFVAIVAAALMLIANLVSLIRGKTSVPRLFTGIYFIGSVMCSIALINNVCFPNFNGIKDIHALFSVENGVLYYAFLIPLFSIFNFLFIAIDKKIKFGAIFVPFGATIIYIIAMLIHHGVTGQDIVNYEFLHIIPAWVKEGESLGKNIVILLILIAVAFGLSLVMWMLNRICHRVIFGSTLEELEEEKKPKEKVGIKQAVTGYLKEAVKFNNPNERAGNCYHISYHNKKLKTWKVKGEEAGRALKVFNTQKEAIDYAKKLVAQKGGSIRIHSMVGRIRKDW